MRIIEVLAVLSLIALAFPSIFLIEASGRLIYPHYLALMVAIPVLFAVRPLQIVLVLPTLVMLLISTALNVNEASLAIVAFHGLHLVAIALLAGMDPAVALRFAKLTIMVYVFAILLARLLELSGLGALAEGLLIADPDLAGEARTAAFATEPAYAGLIMLILGRFVVLQDHAWMTFRRLGLIVATMTLLLSLFALIAAFLLLVIHLHRSGNARARRWVLIGGVILVVGIGVNDYYGQRVAAFDTSLGLMGLGSGTIRLLPYMYLFEATLGNPLPLLWGAGAGAFQPAFFSNLGRFYTNNETLTTHMAAAVYDYGALAVLPFLLWSRPRKPIDRTLYLIMTLLVLLNTGIGTYLFVIFGTYSLIEQRLRSRDKTSS